MFNNQRRRGGIVGGGSAKRGAPGGQNPRPKQFMNNRSNVEIKTIKPAGNTTNNNANNASSSTSINWETKIMTLELGDLIQIEYFSKIEDHQWKPMFKKTSGICSVICLICETNPISNISSIRQHLSGKRHQKRMEIVTELHHPKIDPKKDKLVVEIKKEPAAEMPGVDPKPKDNPTESSTVVKPKETVPLEKRNKPTPVKPTPAEKSTKPIPPEKPTKPTLDENSTKPTPPEKPTKPTVIAKPKEIPTQIKQKIPIVKATENTKVPSKPIAKTANNANSTQDKTIKTKITVTEKKQSEITPTIEAKTDKPQPEAKKEVATVKSNTENSTPKPNSGNATLKTNFVSPQMQKAISDKIQRDMKTLRGKMPYLSSENLKKIKYRFVNTEWKDIFTENENGNVSCVMCKAISTDWNTLKLHMSEKKHRTNLDLTKGLYHPIITDHTEYKPEEDGNLNNNQSGENLSQEKDKNSSKLVINPLSLHRKDDKSVAQQQTENVDQKQSDSIEKENLTPTVDTTPPQKDETPKKNDALEELKKNFAKDMERMSTSDLKLIEFKTADLKWTNMLTELRGLFVCTMCKTSAIDSVKSLKQHIAGKKHRFHYNAARGLFHPIFAPNRNIGEVIENTNSKDTTSKQTETAGKDKERNSNQKSISGTTQSKESVSTVTEENDPKKDENDIIVVTTNPEIIRIDDSPEKELPELQQSNNELVLNPIAVFKNDATTKTPDKNITPVKTITPTATVEKPPSLIPTKSKNVQITLNLSNKSNQLPRTKIIRETTVMSTHKVTVNPTFSESAYKSLMENDVEGLVGVEYVVKILKNINDLTPRFECCLCEFEVDGVGMQWHLKGLNHRLKFLDRHFPTAMKQFQQYRDDEKYRTVLCHVTEKLSMAIENYHGRDLPFECLYDEFRSNRHGIMSKVFSFRHSSEYSGPSFTNIINKSYLEELLKDKKEYSNPLPDPKRKPTFDVNANVHSKRPKENSPKMGVDEHKMLVDQFLKDNNRNLNRSRSPRWKISRSPMNNFGRSRSPRRARRSRSRSPPPSRRTRRSRSPRRYSPRREGDNWQTYRRLFDSELYELERDFRQYKKDPESHPLYNREWTKFWNDRCDELVAVGKDPTTYNFQPEWVIFWTRRMVELQDDDVENTKTKLRSRLGLPLNDSSPECRMMDEKYLLGRRIPHASPISDISTNVDDNSHNVLNDGNQSKRANMPDGPAKPIIPSLFDIGSNINPMNFMRNEEPSSSNYRDSLMESFNISEDVGRKQQQQATIPAERISGSATKRQADPPHYPQKRVQRNDDARGNQNEDEIDTGPLNVVSVLRLLTALEEHLGILGPKVIDLLAKALTLEKVKANAADEALLNLENCSFLETVREKLKGQLIAGVLDPSKIRAVKQAIKNVGKLLNQTNDQNLKYGNDNRNRKQKEPPQQEVTPQAPSIPTALLSNPSPPVRANPLPTTESGMEKVDKHELATKLATALAAQGKTDFTAEQLEQLVAVYIMIERKQRENNLANSGQKSKSLSETLIDYLKPGNVRDSGMGSPMGRTETSTENSGHAGGSVMRRSCGSAMGIDGTAMRIGAGRSTMETGRQTMATGRSTMETGRSTIETGRSAMETRRSAMETRRSTMETERSAMTTGGSNTRRASGNQASFGNNSYGSTSNVRSSLDGGRNIRGSWQQYGQSSMQRTSSGMGNNVETAMNKQSPNVPSKSSSSSYNFGQLSNFDTSLNLGSSYNMRNFSTSYSGGNTSSNQNSTDTTGGSQNLNVVSNWLSGLRNASNTTNQSSYQNLNQQQMNTPFNTNNPNNNNSNNPNTASNANSGMVTYPSYWQRGSQEQANNQQQQNSRAHQSGGQQMNPMGWQQNQNSQNYQRNYGGRR